MSVQCVVRWGICLYSTFQGIFMYNYARIFGSIICKVYIIVISEGKLQNILLPFRRNHDIITNRYRHGGKSNVRSSKTHLELVQLIRDF